MNTAVGLPIDITCQSEENLPDGDRQMIVILDFGSQYSELIARRIRETQVYSEVLSYRITPEEIRKMNPKGIILSGGPRSVYSDYAPQCDPEIWELGIPILGVCYGMQLMVNELGGKVTQADRGEYGKASLLIDEPTHLLTNVENGVIMWMSHGDSVTTMPPGFELLAHTENTSCAAIANHQRKLYGVQFHPEVVHSQGGLALIRNFVYHICDCEPSWTTAAFVENAIQEIRAKVSDRRVLLALSGGVDSSTLAFLLHKAIGDQLTCVFIDQGFMRKLEPERLLKLFQEQFHIPVEYVNARDRFINAIAGVTDPEEKRRRIGHEFIRVFEETSKRLGHFDYLAQGTLYPDVIESAGTNVDPKTGERVAVKIKSHHNVGGLPKDLRFKLVEPLRKLFKDEVRKVGRSLGLPEEIVQRQPFPGPGLAIRILGEVTAERLNILRDADLIVRQEINQRNLYNQYWQAFAVLLPIRSVGVMGDQRTYAYPVVLRIVTSEDGMTADWARVPYDVLEAISNRIVNEVKGVNRVVYDITSKPPGTIEWE
ncbi:GMP synthase (glutamine-hydrolyzing) [Cylindrospermopsis raciborskii S07]|uniref:GMP synthase [glutamine-hydrolyzing] n=1 Tax=Cylindrospermopsis raciborskii C07 TaxID=2014886 RepID=A0ABX4WRH4_9CYAN|nr:glutamine-hydrolyzing GMP synthase [Cylindrospermopsis raciborskii]OHY34057.1 glutamine-hydrolyzing GMP synthase [Cylindrospermopsis raciborskii CS-508]PNJ95215.1 GMP synthase (glutamine-hydrolyzing) [Cylindrospermopsis raciborskii C03]PNJ96661.1 GMP synthase (glutamine-hydrolyzing) [Cylindrospermopsis raciborskii C04]PNJ99855.1 GMP synthase (glutamine-hydrolyzing) [Cylindrospermopsis raciborskii C07]PNK02674.1 GMP synthase (glutamine-hydrolyzing) [Cylindrospermopsis raciborskii S10]